MGKLLLYLRCILELRAVWISCILCLSACAYVPQVAGEMQKLQVVVSVGASDKMRERERGAASVQLLLSFSLLFYSSRPFLMINREHVALDNAALTPMRGVTGGKGVKSKMGTERRADRRRRVGQRKKQCALMMCTCRVCVCVCTFVFLMKARPSSSLKLFRQTKFSHSSYTKSLTQ